MPEHLFVNRGPGRRTTPPVGELVEALCRDNGRIVTLPLLCCWTDADGWVVAGTQRKVPFTVLGWRRADSARASAFGMVARGVRQDVKEQERYEMRFHRWG